MRGQPSIGHEYNERGECIHCGMYRNNVEAMNHVCTPSREKWSDEQLSLRAEQAKMTAIQAEANDHGE